MDVSLEPDEPAEPTARSVLVDMHDLIVDALSELLGEMKMRVVASASSGAEGLVLLERERPDFAIVNMFLPDMTGIYFARRAKTLGLASGLILYSSSGSERLAREALDAGFAAVVRKRIPPDSLFDAVEVVLRGERFVDPSFQHASD
jgi:DNA-binding NarL/FixJ family response regulator